MRRSALKHLAVIVMAMTPALCLALLPGPAQVAPASCGARAAANDSSSAAQTMASPYHIEH